ncbi:hypothetical protein ACFR9U_13790 [Halorientalis brevis]|uniref:Uncharacterized protein n=1 Tax=Halorientalis brevis TaxID=1126241 RepID=A0ABD6CDD8_9EURY
MGNNQNHDPSYVHIEFFDDDRLSDIKDSKNEYGVTWRTMLEFGARYINAVEQAETLDPEHLLEQNQSDPDA